MNQSPGKRATREEILKVSVSLFARQGYEGVSMREIAAAVGIQATALYYHFPDKEHLHRAVLLYAFRDRLSGSIATLTGPEPPRARLRRLVEVLVGELGGDSDLLLLIQRERIENDEARRRLMAEQVMAQPFEALTATLKEIMPGKEVQPLAISIIGLLLFQLESAPIRRFMPGWRAEYDRPEYIVAHLCGLLDAILGEEARHEA